MRAALILSLFLLPQPVHAQALWDLDPAGNREGPVAAGLDLQRGAGLHR